MRLNSVESQSDKIYWISSFFSLPLVSIGGTVCCLEKHDFCDRSRDILIRSDGVDKCLRDIPNFFLVQNLDFLNIRLYLKFSALFRMTTTACIAEWTIDQTHNPRNKPRSPPTSEKRLFTEYVILSSRRTLASSDIRMTAEINSISSGLRVCFRICSW